MADPKEPKKETVRITLPPLPENQPPATGGGGRDTARINLPTRPPSNDPAPRPPAAPPPGSTTPGPPAPPRPPLAQTPLPPAPAKRVEPPPFSRPAPPPPASGGPAFGTVASPPSSTPKAPTPVAPALATAPPLPGPKKETARIAVFGAPQAKAAPSVEMKKTQPIITMPATASQNAPLTVAPTTTESIGDEIPMAFCWALLGVSAVILIIQIWNYFI
jgi:hypothetical protein